MDDFLTSLSKDLKDYASNVCKYTAIEVMNDLTFTAYDSIEKFYDDYDPVYYDRHYDNFMDKSFKKFYHNNRNQVYSGGVELTTDDMDSIYRGTLDQVFTSVYMGFHGLPLSDTPVMAISPYEMIFMRQIYIYEHPAKFIDAGIKKANKEKYIVL